MGKGRSDADVEVARGVDGAARDRGDACGQRLAQFEGAAQYCDEIVYAGPYNPVVSGDMASDLAGVHHLNFDLLLMLVVLHLSAIAWYRLRKGQNLAGTMVTGRKNAPLDAQIESSRLGRALLIAVVVAGAVTALVLLAPPPAVVDYY